MVDSYLNLSRDILAAIRDYLKADENNDLSIGQIKHLQDEAALRLYAFLRELVTDVMSTYLPIGGEDQ